MVPSFDELIARSRLPRLEARALAEHASGCAREWLIAHGDEAAAPAVEERFVALVRRRADGEPLAYLVGHREFYGRRFRVTPAVLIPRPEMELLVQWALQTAPHGARVLELGTGSGAIAITLALERPDLRVLATDVSQAAIELARTNARELIAEVRRAHGDRTPPRAVAAAPQLRLGSWFDALAATESFDLIVSNPPYIAADDAHLREGDLRFEPQGALTDGSDGLGALRVLAAGAPGHLRPGGWAAFEHGWDQGAAARALLGAAGLESVATLRDGEGRERVSLGRRTAAQSPFRRPAHSAPR